jgi:hypothetical protein
MGDIEAMDASFSSAVDALADVARQEFDEQERAAGQALGALDARLRQEFAWLPWLAVGASPGLAACRALRRVAWARRLAKDFAGNLAWEEDDSESSQNIRRCAASLADMAAPGRVAPLWGKARLELALREGGACGLSNLAGALSAGPGAGASWRRLFGALDALDVDEGSEAREAAAALSMLEGRELLQELGAVSEDAAGAKRL